MTIAAAAAAARARIRTGEWTGPTPALAPGAVQANLAILPASWADDFALLCDRNPRPLPLIERTEVGSVVPTETAPSGDLRVDVPRYRVYRDGRLAEEVDDLRGLWRDDFVAFLLGCSFTFDSILARAGIDVRHLTCDCNVPMYITSRSTVAAGRLHGPLVVSMRPICTHEIDRVVVLTGRLAAVHGAPVHVGDPAELGIRDIGSPDYGDAVPINPDEVPAFWACGVTAQAVAAASRVPLMITHAPGHMFITDRSIDDIASAAGAGQSI